MRRATHYDNYNLHCVEISIHALLAESDGLSYFYIIKITISIHALLAESDASAPKQNATEQNFYPRSPCGERHSSVNTADQEARFLSTLSLRRATVFPDPCGPQNTNFYPRSPCGERHTSKDVIKTASNFYPRSPCGERPDTSKTACNVISISIHALLAESDHYDNYNLHCVEISIHALLAESDASNQPEQQAQRDFYPRSPCGERPVLGIQHRVGEYISIHALLAESDSW